jgi:hypothetical protein
MIDIITMINIDFTSFTRNQQDRFEMQKIESASALENQLLHAPLSQSPFLTDDEVNKICEGCTQNAAKVRYLERIGLKVCVRPSGKPLVGRKNFEVVMTGTPTDSQTEPNWSKK